MYASLRLQQNNRLQFGLISLTSARRKRAVIDKLSGDLTNRFSENALFFRGFVTTDLARSLVH